MTERPKKWSDDATCRGRTDLFFSSNWRDWQQAKNLCSVCPVRRICLTDAIEHEDIFGVWGGIDQYELREVLSLDKNGDPKLSTKIPRCPYCKKRNIAVLEKKRSKINYECPDCQFSWWSRRVPVKREPKSAVVDPAVSTGS